MSDWSLNKAFIREGFRIVAEAQTVDLAYHHFIGGTGGLDIGCPGCGSKMFAGWDLDWKDVMLHSLIQWGKPRLSVFICPNCDLYQEQVWVCFKDTPKAYTEYQGTTRAEFKAILPYSVVEASLRPLEAEDYPTNAQYLIGLGTRSRPPGVYHQIGGNAPMRPEATMQCIICKSKMDFLGVLDYDIENVQFASSSGLVYGLEIGDCDYLEVYVCSACQVVGTIFSDG